MSDGSPGIQQIKDQNLKVVPSLPPEYADNIPGFLQSLIEELDSVREENGRLWGERYNTGPIQMPGKGKPYQSNIKRNIQLDREIAKLEARESGLQAQIRDFAALIPPLKEE